MSNSEDNNIYSSAINHLLSRKSWEDYFLRTPCVKSAYLWGIGCGSIMMAHKTRTYRGNLNHAFSCALFTFAFTSTVSLVLCTREVDNKYGLLQKAFHYQGYKEDKKK
jgi:hypothetical protein